MKNVGIIGSGAVGKVLANGFASRGHAVKIGTRNPEKLMEWDKKADQVEITTFEDCASFADIVVLAVKGSAAENLVKDLGDRLDGKVVIDPTNPIEDAPPENGVLKFYTEQNSSHMEALQAVAPLAHFVKAFNSIGSAYMVDPKFDIRPSMFICGNNDEAKHEVSKILIDFGFDVEDMGGAEAARAIEPLCMLWCIPGFLENRWTHAFKLLK